MFGVCVPCENYGCVYPWEYTIQMLEQKVKFINKIIN